MKSLILALFLFTLGCENEAASFIFATEDQPLILTSLLERGQIEKARQEALVQHHEMKDVKSYAGYFTTDKRYNSNLFFWFFLSQSNPETDPTIMWLDGGPGSSSMCAIFLYNGPFIVTDNQTLSLRNHTLLKNHNMLYLDSPAGSGFSFTENKAGYARNESDIDRGVLEFLKQFFTMFPEQRSNDFYITGDSYSGKYCVSIPRAIKRHNDNADESLKINLKGVAFGNGLVDMPSQTRSADFLYHIGLLDANGRDRLNTVEQQVRLLQKLKKSTNSSEIRRLHFRYKIIAIELFKNLTGYEHNLNYLLLNKTDDTNFESYIVSAHVRDAIHVGGRPFTRFNYTVKGFLSEDEDTSEAAALEELLERYKVLIYNGQMDIIAPYPSSEEFYRTLKWSGADEYRTTERKLWWVGSDLAGYWKTAKNMQEVLIRNAGHVASLDQPEWYTDMITRFTRDNMP